MSLIPIKTKTNATPYFNNENNFTKTSIMKNIDRNPNIAKTALE